MNTQLYQTSEIITLTLAKGRHGLSFPVEFDPAVLVASLDGRRFGCGQSGTTGNTLSATYYGPERSVFVNVNVVDDECDLTIFIGA